MQPSQSPKPVAPIRSADTYSPRHSAVTTETKGVISRCQVGPSQAVIVVPDRVDTATHSGQYGGDGIPMSQWVADLLAAIVGHPELMRELDGEDVAQIFARALDNPDLLRGRG